MKMSVERPYAAGFTLPEVLVAFVILSLALGVLLPSFSTGFSGLDASAFHAAALASARSEIDRLGVEIPIEEGELNGRSESGLKWDMRLHVSETFDSRSRGEGNAPVVVPYEVDIVISDGAGRRLTLKTLRLALIE
jgi:general secretion pathway protein I